MLKDLIPLEMEFICQNCKKHSKCSWRKQELVCADMQLLIANFSTKPNSKPKDAPPVALTSQQVIKDFRESQSESVYKSLPQKEKDFLEENPFNILGSIFAFINVKGRETLKPVELYSEYLRTNINKKDREFLKTNPEEFKTVFKAVVLKARTGKTLT